MQGVYAYFENNAFMLIYIYFGVGLFLNVSKPWDAEENIQVMFNYLKKKNQKQETRSISIPSFSFCSAKKGDFAQKKSLKQMFISILRDLCTFNICF